MVGSVGIFAFLVGLWWDQLWGHTAGTGKLDPTSLIVIILIAESVTRCRLTGNNLLKKLNLSMDFFVLLSFIDIKA